LLTDGTFQSVSANRKTIKFCVHISELINACVQVCVCVYVHSILAQTLSFFSLFHKEIKLEIFQVMICIMIYQNLLPLNAGYPANKTILLMLQLSYEMLYFFLFFFWVKQMLGTLLLMYFEYSEHFKH